MTTILNPLPPSYEDMSHSSRSHSRSSHHHLSPSPSYHEESDVEDDMSDLTFDRSAFDTSIYTLTPQQRREEAQLQQQQQQQQREVDVDLELARRGGRVHRFGPHRGYAQASTYYDYSSGSDSSSAADHETRGRRSRSRGEGLVVPLRPLTREEKMSRDLTSRVQQASTFSSSFYSMSTLAIIGQITVMVLMIRDGGILPLNENYMIGPSVRVMLDYGAQQGGYVIYEKQWWRLVTAMFVHAGLVHLLCNVYVQWQVCGFLSALWGRFTWLLIFFVSGVFGNIYSVINTPDAVGVGSSGGLMGVLAAWTVFTIITWKLVPEEQKPERNKQLCSLVVNIAIVILIGQLEFVDGNAHLGGMVQGALLALFLLSDEQASISCKWVVRTLSLASIVALYIWAFVIAWRNVEPSEEVLLEYED